VAGSRKHHTLASATALLAPLTELIERLRAAHAVLADEELSAELAGHAEGNGGGSTGTRYADAALEMSRGLRQLEEWGVIVRDLDAGLCDFTTALEGREVYLCWVVGEERIAHWHEVDAGFAGRRPIDERFGPDAAP